MREIRRAASAGRALILGTLLVVAVGLAGCGNKGGEPKGDLEIAVIPKGTTHEYWKSVHAGAISAADELKIKLIWKGPLREDDREEQIKVIEDFTTRGVSGIVLSPLDESALRPSVTSAVNSGIPVVIIDSALKADNYISYIATNNYHGGEIAADHLISLIGGKGRVMMLRYAEGSASTSQREDGFMDVMRKHPEVTVVSENQHAGVTTESAYKASENLLASVKTADGSLGVDGIFCPCEPVVFGMLRALQDAKLAGKVKFVGFDAGEKMVQALRNGELDALVLQDPFKMGYLGVKTMVEHLRGKSAEKIIDTGATLVTRENMADAKIDKLLNPDLAKYLK